MNPKIKQVAEALKARGVFLGGTFQTFEDHGRDQFIRLLQAGMTPDSILLDFGCGCLRGGLWTIPFLDRRGYFGVEPNENMLSAGTEVVLEQFGYGQNKDPQFSMDQDYSFCSWVVKSKFTHVMAGSIWTHAPAWAIQRMMDNFIQHTTPKARFLGTVLEGEKDNPNTTWVGKSHESDTAGLVSYRLETLQKWAEERGLFVKKLVPNKDLGTLTWVEMTRI